MYSAAGLLYRHSYISVHDPVPGNILGRFTLGLCELLLFCARCHLPGIPFSLHSPQLQLVSSPSSCALLHQRRRRAPQPLNAATSPPSAPFGQTRDADVAPGESRESRESGSTRKKRPLLLGWIKRTVPKVASFLTVMITFHLFRFLLRRLNKVQL